MAFTEFNRTASLGRFCGTVEKTLDLALEDLYCVCASFLTGCMTFSKSFPLLFAPWDNKDNVFFYLPNAIAITTQLSLSLIVIPWNSWLDQSVVNQCVLSECLMDNTKVSPGKWNFTFPDFTSTCTFLVSGIEPLLSFYLSHFHSHRD